MRRSASGIAAAAPASSASACLTSTSDVTPRLNRAVAMSRDCFRASRVRFAISSSRSSLAQREVGVRDLHDERLVDLAAGLLGRDELGERRLVRPADPAPEIELPRHREAGAVGEALGVAIRPGSAFALGLSAVAADVRGAVDRRVEIGARDSEPLAGLDDAFRGGAERVVVGDGASG